MIVFFWKDIIPFLPSGLIFWILAGGITYSAGVIFYAMKKLPYYHAIWHLFVLGGSILFLSDLQKNCLGRIMLQIEKYIADWPDIEFPNFIAWLEESENSGQEERLSDTEEATNEILLSGPIDILQKKREESHEGFWIWDSKKATGLPYGRKIVPNGVPYGLEA